MPVSRKSVVILSLMILISSGIVWCLSSVLSFFQSGVSFKSVNYDQLKGWTEDDHSLALQAFLRSCSVILKMPSNGQIGPLNRNLTAGMWHESCLKAGGLVDEHQDIVRAFFESQFKVFEVQKNGDSMGLFTGYFEPNLLGSRERTPHFSVPLYPPPNDLVRVNLGQFSGDWHETKLIGRVKNGKLVPLQTREEIMAEGLENSKPPLLWLQSETDAFFLHIQGSGRVNLIDGSPTRVKFAASNGRPYTAIGRVLIAEGEIKKSEISMQSIRAWLNANPARGLEVMALNERYIFFEESSALGPVGASSALLSPGRSLAIDTGVIPFHVPVWVETTFPPSIYSQDENKLQTLMVAQDTGSAIRGAVRGDIYWGNGFKAAFLAGKMSQLGRYYILLPKEVANAWEVSVKF